METGEFFTPRGEKIPPIYELKKAIHSFNPDERRELMLIDKPVTLGVPDIQDKNGKRTVSIPDKPHILLVDDLYLSSPQHHQEIYRKNELILFCHGWRPGETWRSADMNDIVQIVWFYNNWIDKKKIDLPKIGAIASCSRAKETKLKQLVRYNLKGEPVYEEAVVRNSTMPPRYEWIPGVIFQKEGTLFLTSSEVRDGNISMTLQSEHMPFVRVMESRRIEKVKD